MNHLLKVFLKIIQGCILNKRKEGTDDTQYRFRNRAGNSVVLFVFTVLTLRYMDVNCDRHFCYIDLRHEKLVEIL